MSAKQAKTPPKAVKSSQKGDKSGKKGPGRPTKRNQALVDKLCELIAIGYSNRQACEQVGLDQCQITRWARKNPEFRTQYAQAMEERCERWADEIIEIADDGLNDWVEREKEHGEMHLVFNGEHFQRSRLRVDTRKWALSKLLPKKYGDKIEHEHTGGINIIVSVGEKK